MSDGFAWNGRTYDSLSKVAFAITGTKWNGPRFFLFEGQGRHEVKSNPNADSICHTHHAWITIVLRATTLLRMDWRSGAVGALIG
jgi:hypothetical protein